MTFRAVFSAGMFIAAAAAFLAGQSPAKSGLEPDNFDRNVRPQDDLFRYANGRWLATAEIPTDRVTLGTFAEMAERTDLSLRAIAEEAARSSAPAGSPVRQIGDLYRSATDEVRLAQLGAEPILRCVWVDSAGQAVSTTGDARPRLVIGRQRSRSPFSPYWST